MIIKHTFYYANEQIRNERKTHILRMAIFSPPILEPRCSVKRENTGHINTHIVWWEYAAKYVHWCWYPAPSRGTLVPVGRGMQAYLLEHCRWRWPTEAPQPPVWCQIWCATCRISILWTWKSSMEKWTIRKMLLVDCRTDKTSVVGHDCHACWSMHLSLWWV